MRLPVPPQEPPEVSQGFSTRYCKQQSSIRLFFAIYSTHSKKHRNLWISATDLRGSNVAHTEILTYVALNIALSIIEDTRNAKN